MTTETPPNIPKEIAADVQALVWEASAAAKTEVTTAMSALIEFMDGQREMGLLDNAIDRLINARATYEKIERVVAWNLGNAL